MPEYNIKEKYIFALRTVANEAWRIIGLSQVGVDASHKDAALAAFLGSAPLDATISLDAPHIGPRVFDLPVVRSLVRAVADEENAVVELGAARACDDAALEELECRLIRFHRDRHGLLRNCSFERSFVGVDGRVR